MAPATTGPAQPDVDALRDLLDIMENFPDNDQRARYLLTCNWMRDRRVTSLSPIFITVKQAAQVLGISPLSCCQLLPAGLIDSHRYDRRHLVHVESLHRYAASLVSGSMGSKS